MKERSRSTLAFLIASATACAAGRAEASDLVWSAYQQAAVTAAGNRDYAKSKKLFMKAMEEATTHHPEGAPERLIQSLLGVSGILIHEADYADAEKILKDALKLSAALGPRHHTVARIHSDLAEVLFKTGKLNDAERHAHSAIDMAEAAEPPARVASLLNDLANIEFARRNHDQAEALARRAMSLAEASAGPASIPAAAALDTLAEIHLDRGQHEQALPLAQKAHEVTSAAASPEHPLLADIHDTLADIHAVLDHKDQAVEHSRKAAEINERHFHRDHPTLVGSLVELRERLGAARHREQENKLRNELEARAKDRVDASATKAAAPVPAASDSR